MTLKRPYGYQKRKAEEIMAEAMSYNLEAVRSDGFVDFYEMLGMAPDAPESDLRDRIQALYSEAQANRDHRNLNKRRDYQTLLEYLPQARTALLDPDKRALYDDYAAAARAGSAPQPFATFMAGLSGQVVGDESTDVLGVQDTRRGTPASRTTAPTATSTRPADAAAPRRQPQVAPKAQAGLMASAMSVIVFAILTLIVGLVIGNWPVGILIGAIAAVVVWFLARPKGGTPVGR